jgi:hypothetical protein
LHLFKAAGGHSSKLSPTHILHTIQLISSGKADTAVQVTRHLCDITNKSLSAETVHQHLKEAGMKAVVKMNKPLLTKHHMCERLDWAIAHKHWTVEDWKRIVWSDETNINCLGPDSRKLVWKKAGEGLNLHTVQGTLKFGGGSLMVWGCMMWKGIGYACKIDGRMNGSFTPRFWKMNFKPASSISRKS